jgi:hypothetical protein
LANFELRVVDGRLQLRVKKSAAHLFTETAQRRLDYAAAALGLVSETKIV